MATWQFNIEFIPRAWAIANEYDTSILQGSEGYSTSCTWLNHQPFPEYTQILDEVLPKAMSWHKSLLLWGSTENDDIQLWLDNNSVSSIRLRIDLRRDPTAVLLRALKASKELNCVWYFPEYNLIQDAIDNSILEAIAGSSAAQFVAMDEAKLRSLWMEQRI